MPNAGDSPGLVFNFKSHPETSSFAVPPQTYISTHPDIPCKYIATGAFVFDSSSAADLRILLIQRSEGDSMPGLWEVPGGGSDNEDESILHSVARELWEEAGLTAVSIGPPIGEPHFFTSRTGKQICKFNFLVEVEQGKLDVKLDPSEHQSYVWASEEEVRSGRSGTIDLRFTMGETENGVLEAFKFKRSQTNERIGTR